MSKKNFIKKLTAKVIVTCIGFCLLVTLMPAEIFAANQTLAKPKFAKVEVYNSNNVKLQWSKAKNATKYKVYQKKADGKFKLVKTTTKRNYNGKKLAYGTKYTYKVTAITKAGKKNTSKVKTVYTKPAKPVITVKVQNKNQVKIIWKKTKGAVKYKVYQKKADGKFVLLKTTTKLSYICKKLTYDTKYTYKVTAVSKAGKTITSKSKMIQTEVDLMTLHVEMLKQINAERKAIGVEPLKLYYPVSTLAQIKAEDLYKTKVFDHYSENLGYFNNQYDQAEIRYDGGGENIAAGYTSVEGAMNIWMNSPGHKANILSPEFTHVGIGYCNGYWVQQFISEPYGGFDLFEIGSFTCIHCGARMSESNWYWKSGSDIIYLCPSCDELVRKCIQCKDGYYYDIGIAHSGDHSIARRCNVCKLDQCDDYIENCPNCHKPILNNYIKDNYTIFFQYADGDARISIATYACKSCGYYAATDSQDNYREYYTDLENDLSDGENIYDRIVWKEELGYEESGNTNIGGMEGTMMKPIYGPDFSWPMETLDDICKYKYKYSSAQ